MNTRLSCTTILLALASTWSASAATAQAPTTQPYDRLDRIEDDWINRNPIPIRPMALGSGSAIWAVNPYLSTVNRITGTSIDLTFPTLAGPVAIATYTPTAGPALLLVVCQHSNAVAFHNTANGDMLAMLRTAAQPQDLIVDQANHRLWVSCAAADLVQEFDLTGVAAVRNYVVRSKLPITLVMGSNRDVFVAPRVSGNGSLAHRAPSASVSVPTTMAGSRGIVDTTNPNVASVGLPDEDLFWLDRGTGTAVPVFKGMGTLLFGGAIRPTSILGAPDQLWLLNTDANNNDPAKQSEASIRGDIVDNRVTIVNLPALPPAGPVTPAASAFVDLDDDTAPIGNPYSLAFSADGSTCYVVGLLTSNVLELGSNGARTGRRVALTNAMPRQILLDQSGTGLWVWCGDNTVSRVDRATMTTTLTGLSLGFDPTPAKIAAGRKVFFDASHSQHGNASCASCHDEGRTDMLVWNLSKVSTAITPNDGVDNKGPMVTQTLVGIDKALPFHWRGEQRAGLSDFNGAFADLLGGTPLNATDFDAFQAYVLSLKEDANQFQAFTRELVAPTDPLAPNPINGQAKFLNTNPGLSCISCHPLPTATSNEIIRNNFTLEARDKRLWLKAAPFQGLQYKGTQPRVPISLVNPNETFPDWALIGTGLAHAGVNPDNLQFAEIMLDGAADIANVAEFLRVFDTGIAPSAHAVFLARKFTVNQTLIDGLVAEASATKRNCDLAVFGRIAVGGVVRAVRYWYERDRNLFLRDDNVEQSLGELVSEVTTSTSKWLAFVGLPVGTGRAFAIDYDRDLLPNGLDNVNANSPFVLDSDGDGSWDGPEFFFGGDPANPAVTANDTTAPTVTLLPSALVNAATAPFQWVTERIARLTFETDEPTVASLVLTPLSGGGNVVATEDRPKMHHNLLVTGLQPGTQYQGQLNVSDLATTPHVVSVSLALTTMSERENAAVLASLAIVTMPQQPGSVKLRATGVVTDRRGALQSNMIVVARVFVDGAPVAVTGTGQLTSIRVDGVPYGLLQPPSIASPVLVLSAPTSASGAFTLNATIPDPGASHSIELAIEAIGLNLGTISTSRNIQSSFELPVLATKMPGAWSLPDTPAAFRRLRYR